MALRSGARLGPYEILAPLGAGGMGEVYRARDARLERDVALKVLPADAAADSDRRHRFEREARAVAALDHPHVLAIHDVGTDGDVAYVVFELVEGETLRRRLVRGALPPRKAVEYGIQLCRGLAAAHARGILHRDLKPENVILTRDGSLKILDFGLAKLALGPEGGEGTALTTETRPGILMGTVGYLAPEQAWGQAADARSDVFAVGVVLYEMLAGVRPFRGETGPEVLAALLKEDPPELVSPAGPVPPSLDRLVRRCLEKDPEDRFQSARDVAFALEALSGSGSTPSGALAAVGEPRRAGVRLGAAGLPALALAGALLLAAGPAGWVLGRRSAPPRLPEITQLTFRLGAVDNARFVPGGRAVVYTALFDGQPSEVYEVRLEDPESRPLDLAPARVLAVSSRDELAILTGRPDDASPVAWGTLARVPLSGGPPRPVREGVIAADWSPDAREMAILCWADTGLRLEYPVGTVLAEPLADARELRVDPSGERVAVLTSAAVLIVDRSGRTRRFDALPSTQGLAWDPDGQAIWVSAGGWGEEGGRTGRSRNLVDRVEVVEARGLWRLSVGSGRWTEAYRAAGGLVLDDVAPDGRLLAHHGLQRAGVRVKAPGEAHERDLEMSAWGIIPNNPISADGTQVLTLERTRWSTQAYLRPLKGGPGTRVLADPPTTDVFALSPDARWVLIGRDPKPGSAALPPQRWWGELTLVPTGPGEPRVIPTDRFEDILSLVFEANGHIQGSLVERGGTFRNWMHPLDGGDWRPITPEGVAAPWIRWPQDEVVGIDVADGTYARYPLAGGEPRPFPGSIPRDLIPYGLTSPDGRYGFLYRIGIPVVFERIDLETGARTPWRSFGPEDRTGLVGTSVIGFYPDREVDAWAYSYTRRLENLYLLEGLR